MTKFFSDKHHRKKIGPRKRYFSCSCWGSELTVNDEINSNEIYTISEQLNRSLTSRKETNIYVNYKEDSVSCPSSNSNTSTNSIQSSDSSSDYLHTLKYSYCPNFFDGCKEYDDEKNPYNSMNYIDDVLTQSARANEILKHNNHHFAGRNIRPLNAQPFRKIWKWCIHSISGDY